MTLVFALLATLFALLTNLAAPLVFWLGDRIEKFYKIVLIVVSYELILSSLFIFFLLKSIGM